jgi:hypothetical protein
MNIVARAFIGAAALFLGAIASASATPLQTITMTGTTGYGYDGSGQFGSSGGDLGNKSYTLVISYDPTALKNDTCGAAANTSCTWNFGASGITETLTINAITKSYTLTSGTIQFCACSSDQVYINAQLGGTQFGLNFSDTNKLFSSHTNVNLATLLLNVTSLPVTSTNFQTSGLGGNASGNGGQTSLGFNPTAITTNFSTGAAVPEPFTLSIFGAGLVGAAAMRRRKKKA